MSERTSEIDLPNPAASDSDAGRDDFDARTLDGHYFRVELDLARLAIESARGTPGGPDHIARCIAAADGAIAEIDRHLKASSVSAAEGRGIEREVARLREQLSVLQRFEPDSQ